MAQEAEIQDQPAFDPTLLARMTGELGEGNTIAKLSHELAQVYSEFLPDVFHSETGYDLEVTFEAVKTGLKEELVAQLGPNVAICDGSLKNWCPDFVLGCGSSFVVTLVEAMLGAEPDTIEPSPERPLSKIELDLTSMIFAKIANVLRSAIPTAGSHEPILSDPYNQASRPKPPEGHKDPVAAMISMNIILGKTESLFHVVIPQKNLLKTKVSSPKSSGTGRTKKEWTDQIQEQVQRSEVTVEARIKLQSLSLGTISRLQAGDVIPFDAPKDVRVEVNANGKDLYFGEFGRSGAKYTVRITDTYTTEADLLTHLMS